MFKTLSLFLLLQGASAMYVKINGYECSEKAMSLTLTKICNDDNTCLLGETSNIEGYLNYYGMVDEFGIDSDSYAYVDFSLKFTQNGAAIYSHDIYQLQQMPICGDSMTAIDGGSCPSGGRYSFTQSLYLPPLENSLKDWGYSGFNGQGQLIAYMGEDNGSTVLGYCTFDITTTTSGALTKAPSGRAVLFGIFGAISFLLIAATCGFFCARKETKVAMVNKVSSSTNRFVKKTKQAVGVSTSPNDFKAMEEQTNTEAKQNWKLDWDSSADAGNKHSNVMKEVAKTARKNAWKQDWDSKAAIGKHAAQRQVMNV